MGVVGHYCDIDRREERLQFRKVPRRAIGTRNHKTLPISGGRSLRLKVYFPRFRSCKAVTIVGVERSLPCESDSRTSSVGRGSRMDFIACRDREAVKG